MIYVDANNNIYYGTSNNTLVKINSSGTVLWESGGFPMQLTRIEKDKNTRYLYNQSLISSSLKVLKLEVCCK